MKVLQELKNYLTNYGLENAGLVGNLIDQFKEERERKYSDMKSKKLFVFGKYEGQSPVEISKNERGAKYLTWFVRQSWAKKNHGDLVLECYKIGITSSDDEGEATDEQIDDLIEGFYKQ
jgi:uncharacterized protein (DUF3820 family)